jgi:hypothetical protein
MQPYKKCRNHEVNEISALEPGRKKTRSDRSEISQASFSRRSSPVASC